MQSRTSRRGRRRSARRRRRGHPGADAAQVLRPQGGRTRLRPAGARPLRGRRRVHAARSGMAEGHPRRLCGEDPAGRPHAARLARDAARQFLARRVGEADRAVPHAGVRRTRPRDQERGRVRAQALHPAQGHLRRDLPQARAAAVELLRRARCRAAPSSTRACSSPTSSASIIPTCTSRISRPRSALVHQRFSTNTFPSWPLAHPYRMVAHNGEINTLRGNVNWMAARQASVSSKLFGDDITKLWPISYEGQSDTACFDNALEFLVQGGYSLAHAAMMLIPEAWAGNPLMDDERKAFYEYSRRADGAVGRPRRDRLHRRTPDRRNARPQWPASGALARHRGRPRHHGVGSGRAADPGKRDRAEVAPAAGQDAAGRPGRRPHHRRRRDQGAARQDASLREVAEEDAARAGRLAGVAAAQAAHQPVAARSPAVFWLHARKTCRS